MMKKRVIAILAAALAALAVWAAPAFGNGTCSNSAIAIESFLEEWNGQEITVLRSAREGRVRAVLYENEAGQLGVNIFERRLLGLRLKHDGMNLYDKGPGLYLSGEWTEGGLKGSRCEIVVCGDNHGAEVWSYTVADAEGVSDRYAHTGYVLDIYILDGITALPRDLRQYGPDGSIFVN